MLLILLIQEHALSLLLLVFTLISFICNFRLPKWLSGKEFTCQTGGKFSILGSGKSPGGGNGNPLQDSCLGNPMDGGAWHSAVYGIVKSQTQVRNWKTTICSLQLSQYRYFTFFCQFIPMYFTLSIAMLRGIVSTSSLSDVFFLLLVYRNSGDLWALILYPENIPNSLIVFKQHLQQTNG